MTKPIKCKACGRTMRETPSSRGGRGPLKELFCAKCQVAAYIDRTPKSKPSKRKPDLAAKIIRQLRKESFVRGYNEYEYDDRRVILLFVANDIIRRVLKARSK